MRSFADFPKHAREAVSTPYSPDAVVNAVGIRFENLLLAEIFLNAKSEQRFDEFSVPAVLAKRKRVPGELLRDCACSFLDISRVQIAHCGPGDSRKIDAAVLVEPRILSGQQSFDEIRRDLRQRHDIANFPLESAVAHAGVIEDFGNCRNPIEFGEIETVSNPLVVAILRINEKEGDDSQAHAGKRGEHDQAFNESRHGCDDRNLWNLPTANERIFTSLPKI